MQIKSQKDFFSGLLFFMTGAAFAWGAAQYRLGTSAHMGPGYFPLLCSILLMGIGVVLCIKAISLTPQDDGLIGRWALRPVVLITGANILFGILLGGWSQLHIPVFGFAVAALILVVVAAMAGPEFKAREALILALILTIGSWLVFIFALNMQMPSWPSFLSL
ncbi:tripartite tricarboxylate transporter TctB family protein [Castellaniella sp.]|uniref:tripartite tricarboxylate transporter TctB family protein n=1 Tax=Castellaniella sp. TaxID=1955812 RepID=UPI002AFE716E|nr:tripartite tricarboxylate transporter TctB family protein [Castellaniella sp.]